MLISKLASSDFKAAVQKLMAASLPIKTTFRLKKFIVGLEVELKIFEETRESIVKEYGEKDEDGTLKTNEQGLISLDAARASEWQTKLSELFSLETQIDVPKISIEDLCEDVKLSANDLFALGELISE